MSHGPIHQRCTTPGDVRAGRLTERLYHFGNARACDSRWRFGRRAISTVVSFATVTSH